MKIEEFIIEVEKLGINLTKEQLKKLEHFYELLISWNEKMNLTRITEKEEVYLKHFYDSLTITKVVDLKKIDTLCDVGSGAGFPGIVLKIVFPNLKITLIDSLQKRVNYLNEILEDDNLDDENIDDNDNDIFLTRIVITKDDIDRFLEQHKEYKFLRLKEPIKVDIYL